MSEGPIVVEELPDQFDDIAAWNKNMRRKSYAAAANWSTIFERKSPISSMAKVYLFTGVF